MKKALKSKSENLKTKDYTTIFNLGISIVLSFLHTTASFSQMFKIDLQSKTYRNDTMIIGNFYGDKQLIQDTLFRKDNHFVWATDTMPRPGVYFALLMPKNTYFQILINGADKRMEFTFDANDLEFVQSTGSLDNKLFNDYVFFLKDKRVIADTLRAKIERGKAAKLDTKSWEDEFAGLDKIVKTYQDNIIQSHPDLLVSMMLKSNQEVPIPDYEGDEKEVQVKKYLFFKEHYFDYIPMKDIALIRTPFIHQKLDFYINKAVSQEPDSLIKAVDRILNLLDGNQQAYDYYLSYFLNTYGQLKMVGHDAIVVHLADKYYLKGKAKWSTPENIEKLSKSVDDFRPTLIGRTMPNFTTYREDGSPVTLYDLKTPYTLMAVWDPDCGNCKKTMPFVVDFYKKFKDKGVSVLTICNKSGEKANTCWPYVKEKGMEGLINTGDQYQRWNQVVRNTKVPKLIIMDKNKKILMKDMSGEDLEKVFQQIYDFDMKKTTEGSK